MSFNPPSHDRQPLSRERRPSSLIVSNDRIAHGHTPSPVPSSADFVHLSEQNSRQTSPFIHLESTRPHTQLGSEHHYLRAAASDRHTSQQEEVDDFDQAWEETEEVEEEEDSWSTDGSSAMPSDLRSPSHKPTSQQHQPLLSGSSKQNEQDTSKGRPGLPTRRSTSHFKERESDATARSDTRKRYTYAAGFLILSLISFAVQTETAVYIQHNLKWKKPYCMLYFTHGSWSLLWPVQLLILRIQKRAQPFDAFWRRHISILRSTAQMIEHRTLTMTPTQQKKSPWPYFLRTTIFVTCALTVAGGSWYVAVDLTTPSDLTAIYNCSAFFAYAFAVPLLGERLRLSKVAAVAIAIVGVLAIAYGDGSTAKHGSKSGGGSGGSSAPDDADAANRTLGNLVIGVGSVLYGFYEVLYKRVACPPDGCSPGRGMLFANTFGTMMGVFTLSVLWIPLVVLHVTGLEPFELPRGEAAWMLVISVLANATFSGSFLVLISLISPVLSSVAALLTIFLVALCDQLLPPPLYSPLTGAAVVGGVLIIAAFALLSWATYREMLEERMKKPEERVEESDIEDEDDV